MVAKYIIGENFEKCNMQHQ